MNNGKWVEADKRQKEGKGERLWGDRSDQNKCSGIRNQKATLWLQSRRLLYLMISLWNSPSRTFLFLPQSWDHVFITTVCISALIPDKLWGSGLNLTHLGTPVFSTGPATWQASPTKMFEIKREGKQAGRQAAWPSLLRSGLDWRDSFWDRKPRKP